MNKIKALIKRNFLETIRNPISTVFCIAFPSVLFILLSIVFKTTGFTPANFIIQNFTPGICIMAYAFTMLTVATTIAGDKNSSFTQRILLAPVKFSYYILSVLISALPILAVQTLITYLLGFVFGLPLNLKTLASIVYLIPSGIFYVLLGICIGLMVKSVKNVGPICSILINVITLFGGVFLPTEIISGGLKTIINILPFIHTLNISSHVFTIGFSSLYPHILYILAYSIVIILSIVLLSKKFTKNI